MERFTAINSIVAPVPIKDVDTDMIIPAQFLTSVSRDGFGAHLFTRLRASRPDFYLNHDRYLNARILIADSNFGCGSSREHAVWALLDAGIRVVIAPSYADIFASNSAKNGLLLISLPENVNLELMHEAESGCLEVAVDLNTQSVSVADGRSWSFEYDPFRKHCILNGLDDLDYLRSHLGAISDKKRELAKSYFFSTDRPNR